MAFILMNLTLNQAGCNMHTMAFILMNLTLNQAGELLINHAHIKTYPSTKSVSSLFNMYFMCSSKLEP